MTQIENKRGAHDTSGTSALLQEFNDAAAKAYVQPYLVANSTLSKVNQHTLFFRYSQGKAAQSATLFAVARNIVLFYFKSAYELLMILGSASLHKFSSTRTFTKSGQELFIDAYVVIGSTPKSTLNNYLPMLTQVAVQRGWKVTILPRIYGSRNPFLKREAITSLRTGGIDVLTELDLLTPSDYLYLCVHILIYPWLALALARTLPRTREGLFVRFAILSEIGQSSLSGAIRYRFGQHLASIVSANDRLIQWYENQPYDKTLNRGFRNAGAKTPIYGAQLLIGPREFQNLQLDKNEPRSHSPNRILVIGSLYLDRTSNIPYEIGPALRYAELFKHRAYMHNPTKVLVLMSYIESSARYTQKLALQTQLSQNLVFKFHPAAPHPNLQRLIPGSSQTTKGTLYEALENTKLLIGSGSGALLEAIVMGISVIVTREPGVAHFTYVPDIGRGLLWVEVSSAREMQEAINQLSESSANRKEEILAARNEMRRQCFAVEPTAETIRAAFNL